MAILSVAKRKWSSYPYRERQCHGAFTKGCKDPNNRVPFKGGIKGYIRIYGDYIGLYRTQIIRF